MSVSTFNNIQANQISGIAGNINLVAPNGDVTIAPSNDIVLNPTGLISASGNKIENVADPVNAQDAVTRNFWNTNASDAFGAGLAKTGSDLVVDQSYGFTWTSGQNFGGLPVSGVGEPVGDQDAANKSYVDALAEGLSPKQSVVAASTAALPVTVVYNNSLGPIDYMSTLTATNNGILSLDDINISLNQRVLIKDQSNLFENGIYVMTIEGDGLTPFVLTRSSDMNSMTEFAGSSVFIQSGTSQSDQGWVCTANDPIVIGVTAITWSQFSSQGVITAGPGLSKTGNEIKVDSSFDFVGVSAWEGNQEFKTGFHHIESSAVGDDAIELSSLVGGISINTVTPLILKVPKIQYKDNSGTDVSFKQIMNVTQTTDATATEMSPSIVIIDNTSNLIEVSVSAHDALTKDCAIWNFRLVVKKDGSVTLGVPQSFVDKSLGDSSWDVSIATNVSDQVVVVVNGSATATVNWTATASVIFSV
jgi:hypothetical protein